MIRIYKYITCFLLSFAVFASTLADESGQEEKSLELSTGEVVDYLFYQPSELEENQKPPLLLFLHGGGESGDDLSRVLTHGPPKRIAEGHRYPMIVVSPLNPDKKGFWDEDRLARFLDELLPSINFDEERVYLAGMSRGAYGGYRLVMENPDRFAAMVALCGAAPSPYAGWLGKIPVWIIHGEKDPVIPVSESQRMAEALREKGGNVRLTLHPESEHDVWTQTFEGTGVEEWLLQHKRSTTKP